MRSGFFDNSALIMTQIQQLLTAKDIAEKWRVCHRTVICWKERGWLPYIKLGKAVRFLPEDVERLLASRKVGGK
jgi:Helix-turn-helix domain